MKPRHNPETEEYGIKSWVYRRAKPFHPQRFYYFLTSLRDDENHLFRKCVRAKGTIWLATRYLNSLVFQKSGALFDVQPLNLWYASLPKSKWGETDDEIEDVCESLKDCWTLPYGDRRQEIVLIGMDMDQVEMENMLDKIMLTDKEFNGGLDQWKKFTDPFTEEYYVDLEKQHAETTGKSGKNKWLNCLAEKLN